MRDYDVPTVRVTDRRSARFALRDATAPWHARVDTIFSNADLSVRSGYSRFLSAQAAAYIPIEQALEVSGIATVLADWPSRRRSHLIREDLEILGLALPCFEPQPCLHGIPALLGAAYVLEGSRLGGAVLKRSVPAALPTRFLSASRPQAWRDLIAIIDARLIAQEDLDAAIEAACAAFALFERCGRAI
ncbi:MAG: biliverdin-producing heme oxygenase [Pseudomonadota bacterium]